LVVSAESLSKVYSVMPSEPTKKSSLDSATVFPAAAVAGAAVGGAAVGGAGDGDAPAPAHAPTSRVAAISGPKIEIALFRSI